MMHSYHSVLQSADSVGYLADTDTEPYLQGRYDPPPLNPRPHSQGHISSSSRDLVLLETESGEFCNINSRQVLEVRFHAPLSSALAAGA